MANYTVKIRVDAEDNASRTLGGISGVLSHLGEGVTSLGTLALSGLGMVAGAAAGAAVGIGALAVQTAPLQDVRAAFDGIAVSAGTSGEAMLQALQKGTAGMIPARDLMLTFNKASQLVGQDFAVQLPDAMQYLSKVSAATGQDMGFMLDSLVVGVGRLSPMILDNLGIQVSLEDATARAAKMFGVEADSLTKSQIQAGMMNVVLEKLAANTSAMPDMTQSANAQWARLKATLVDVKDQVGLAFVPTLNDLLATLQPLITAAMPVFTDLLSRAGAFASQVAQAVGAFVQQVAEGVDPLTALQNVLTQFRLEEVAAAVGQVRDEVVNLWAQVQPYAEQVVAWIAEHVELKDVLIALGIAIAAVVIPAIASVVSAAAPVIATAALLIAAVTAIRTAWESDFLGIRTFVETTLATISQWWTEHGEQVKATVQGFLDALQGIWEQFAAVWQEVFAAFREAFQGNWSRFGEHLRSAWDAAWENIKEIGKKAWDAIKRFFSETDWGGVGKAILEGIANGIKAGIDWLKDAAKDAAQAAYDAARGFLGIRSPSRLFEGIGQQMMKGMALGIEGAAIMPEVSLTRAIPTPSPAQNESRTVIIYGGVNVGGAQNAGDLLRQLWEIGYA